LVLVRRGDRFLLVHEASHGQRWYFPAGRVEPGERIVDAAVRETREEAGVPIVLEGIVRIEHSVRADGSARCRVFFLARPVDETPPKSVADSESLEARWVHPDELDGYALRGDEVREALRAVVRGAPVMPLALLTEEETPW
jgi:phosphatase NudJ